MEKQASDKFYNLLGLCQRAGRLVSGEMMSEKIISLGQAQLVILSEEASFNTLEKFKRLCKHKETDVIIIGKKEELGRSIGKPSRTVLAIIDKNFSDMLLSVFTKKEL